MSRFKLSGELAVLKTRMAHLSEEDGVTWKCRLRDTSSRLWRRHMDADTHRLRTATTKQEPLDSDLQHFCAFSPAKFKVFQSTTIISLAS